MRISTSNTQIARRAIGQTSPLRERAFLIAGHRPLVTARPAFTLVELLVTITIMSILAAIALFALAGVGESAKRDKTIATIRKLNALVMGKYESYRTRRLPITASSPNSLGTTYPIIQQPTQGQSIAKYKVDAMRDFMRMEMPDRFSDIDDPPITKTEIGGSAFVASPAEQVAYQASIPPIASRNVNSEIFEAAKCLYLIVSKGLRDPDIMSLFNDDEIAIDPTDHMRYFVDGWGNQILFLRWAPGFYSPLQVDPANATTHDPFDPMGLYKTSAQGATDAYHTYDANFPTGNKPPLYPLIYSSGGASIVFDQSNNNYFTPTEIEVRPTVRAASQNNDPYYTVGNGNAIGSWIDSNGDGSDGREQDITNQDMSVTQ